MRILLCVAILGIMTGCQHKKGASTMSNEITIKKSLHGNIEGTPVALFTLSNNKGVEIRISEYGGIITHIFTNDKNGKSDDIVLGFDSLEEYLNGHPYFGAIIGRYGNRIADGKFSIEGITYTLATNNAPNSLHGGVKGFDKFIWQGEVIDSENEQGVVLSRTSPDMEEGFPGNLKTKVKYLLDNDNQLKIVYTATTDKTTIVNLTNHSYFNLGGAGNGNILKQELMIESDYITPVSASLIPTGEIMTVTNTPFDFRLRSPIGRRINQPHPQMKYGGGYDHNYVRNGGKGLREVAKAYDPISGRVLSVITKEPGVQLYTGNFLENISGKKGKVYNQRSGFCLETQHYPDAPNQPNFPSTLLEPKEAFESITIYKFEIEQ